MPYIRCGIMMVYEKETEWNQGHMLGIGDEGHAMAVIKCNDILYYCNSWGDGCHQLAHYHLDPAFAKYKGRVWIELYLARCPPRSETSAGRAQIQIMDEMLKPHIRHTPRHRLLWKTILRGRRLKTDRAMAHLRDIARKKS